MTRTKQTALESRPEGHAPLKVYATNKAVNNYRKLVQGGILKGGEALVLKKRHRYRNGTRALMDMKRLQKENKLVLRKRPFSRLVREQGAEFKVDLRFTKGSMRAIQETAEHHLMSILGDSNLAAIHCKRVTVMPKDITLTEYFRGLLSDEDRERFVTGK